MGRTLSHQQRDSYQTPHCREQHRLLPGRLQNPSSPARTRTSPLNTRSGHATLSPQMCPPVSHRRTILFPPESKIQKSGRTRPSEAYGAPGLDASMKPESRAAGFWAAVLGARGDMVPRCERAMLLGDIFRGGRWRGERPKPHQSGQVLHDEDVLGVPGARRRAPLLPGDLAERRRAALRAPTRETLVVPPRKCPCRVS